MTDSKENVGYVVVVGVYPRHRRYECYEYLLWQMLRLMEQAEVVLFIYLGVIMASIHKLQKVIVDLAPTAHLTIIISKWCKRKIPCEMVLRNKLSRSAGCCCNWSPSCVRNLNWEIWGAGGNGNGVSCNRCPL